MEEAALRGVCIRSLEQERFVYLSHRGIARDVYPYSIREGRLYCYCSLHPEREVESMWLSNIEDAVVSRNEIGLIFPYESDFAPEEED